MQHSAARPYSYRMRRSARILVAALLAGGVPAAAQAPAAMAVLKGGFSPGRWQVRVPGDEATRPRTLCITSADSFLMGGRGGQCRFNIISDGPTEAVVTYRCDSGLSGRTALRRDTAGLYTLDTQGLEGGIPFGAREEWRRTGPC
jgi:hypothetical protein